MKIRAIARGLIDVVARYQRILAIDVVEVANTHVAVASGSIAKRLVLRVRGRHLMGRVVALRLRAREQLAVMVGPRKTRSIDIGTTATLQRLRNGGTRRKLSLDGWVEFLHKRDAKFVVENLSRCADYGRQEASRAVMLRSKKSTSRHQPWHVL